MNFMWMKIYLRGNPGDANCPEREEKLPPHSEIGFKWVENVKQLMRTLIRVPRSTPSNCLTIVEHRVIRFKFER